MTTRGHCLCKKTSWSFDGEITWSCYCHCDSCRRNTGAPVTIWIGIPLKHFKWTGEMPKAYESSEGVWRHFCATCGSPIAFEAAHYAGGMHLNAATMQSPGDFKPTFHVNYDSKLHWLPIDDDLPKYDSKLLDTPQDLSDYD